MALVRQVPVVDPNIRHWDPKGRYADSYIKCYEHWCLEVSYMQHTLGCFALFSRHKVERLSELSGAALAELADVNREIETALGSGQTFQPDRYNYLQLGNVLHHLHIHGVPRYVAPRFAFGREWKDNSFGAPPMWLSDDVEVELVVSIRDEIISLFKQLNYLD